MYSRYVTNRGFSAAAPGQRLAGRDTGTAPTFSTLSLIRDEVLSAAFCALLLVMIFFFRSVVILAILCFKKSSGNNVRFHRYKTSVTLISRILAARKN